MAAPSPGPQAGGGHDARQSDIDVQIYQPISILGAKKRQKEVKKVWPDAKKPIEEEMRVEQKYRLWGESVGGEALDWKELQR